MYTDFSTGDKTSFDQTDVTDAVLQHDAVPETIMTDPDPVSQPQAEAQLDVQVASSSEVEDMEEAGTDGTSEEVVKKEDAKKLDDDSLRPKSQNKEPLKEYFCKVCKAKCSGDAIYQQHLQGNRHRKNLANAKIGAPIIRNIKKKGKKVARLTAKLSGVEEALLGLEYLIEHQKEDETIEERYICDLCEAKCDPRTVIFHVTGTKHRMAYLKKHHPESLSEIAARREAEIKRSVLSSKLAEIAKEVEKEHGRKPIQVKVELDPFYNPYHQRLEAAATQKRMMLMDEGLVPPQKLQRFEGGPMGGGRGRARGRGGFPVRGGRGVGRFADRGRGGGGGRGRGGPPRDGRGVRSHGGQPSRAPLLGPGPSPLLMPPEESL
ncbi:uncharacterized protein [Ptychodera flava]|uniref:uncharacterized protein isoform X2 n=1 Tax=Ptychodera flava TaxID=63121 RepID=UPI003969E7DD